ncbi:MAG: hypothetical protein JW818_19630 [Pirellulales bacterium]|nr:hypothetical protein [Pirellulales bacterium]
MIRSVVRWLRVTCPPMRFVVAYLGFDALFVLSGLVMFTFLREAGQLVIASFAPGLDGSAVLAALSYGAFRVFGFHPAFRPGYCRWLAATPWTHRRPLPDGPVHLLPQDAIFLALILLMTPGIVIPRIVIPFAFLSGYLLLSVFTLAWTGVRLHVFVVLFGFGVAALLFGSPWHMLAVFGLLTVVATLGLKRSLAKSPLEPIDLRAFAVTPAYGWPWSQLHFKIPGHQFTRTDRISVSLLAGWWFLVAVCVLPMKRDVEENAIFTYLVLCGFAVLIRFMVYFIGFFPPISLWGRLWTGRLIIPGYDHMLLTPLCATVIAFMGPTALAALGVPFTIGCPVFLVVVLLVVLTVGPSYRKWALTGRHRIVPIKGNTNAKQI